MGGRWLRKISLVGLWRYNRYGELDGRVEVGLGFWAPIGFRYCNSSIFSEFEGQSRRPQQL